MKAEPIHPALHPARCPAETDAATAILRMLTSDRLEPVLRCRADGDQGVALN